MEKLKSQKGSKTDLMAENSNLDNLRKTMSEGKKNDRKRAQIYEEDSSTD